MRHRVAGKKLSRHRGHRKALFKNLISGLILHGEIKTTESKAKAVRPLVEKLITKGKAGTLHARRIIAAFLQNKKVVNRIVDEIGPIFKSRPGGYTRIIRLGRRRGDNAMMVKLELVDKPAAGSEPAKRGKKKAKKPSQVSESRKKPPAQKPKFSRKPRLRLRRKPKAE